jgi:hypothetical protein
VSIDLELRRAVVDAAEASRPPAHGYVPYTHGCRCAVCKDAKARYVRDRRAVGHAS